VSLFLSDPWIADVNRALADIDIPAVNGPAAGLAVRHGVFSTTLQVDQDSGTDRHVTVHIAAGRLTLSAKPAPEAAVTVRLSGPDARAFMSGTWEPGPALAAGRAQVRGDLAVLDATTIVLAGVAPQLSGLLADTEYRAAGHDTSKARE
jgi:hypothetical protein